MDALYPPPPPGHPVLLFEVTLHRGSQTHVVQGATKIVLLGYDVLSHVVVHYGVDAEGQAHGLLTCALSPGDDLHIQVSAPTTASGFP